MYASFSLGKYFTIQYFVMIKIDWYRYARHRCQLFTQVKLELCINVCVSLPELYPQSINSAY